MAHEKSAFKVGFKNIFFHFFFYKYLRDCSAVCCAAIGRNLSDLNGHFSRAEEAAGFLYRHKVSEIFNKEVQHV